MKKSIAVLLVCIFMISALFSCAEGGSVTTGEITDGPETDTTADETTAEPVKEYPSEDDNYAGTPAYTQLFETSLLTRLSDPMITLDPILIL